MAHPFCKQIEAWKHHHGKNTEVFGPIGIILEILYELISLKKEVWRLELVVFHSPFLKFVCIGFIGYSSLLKCESKTHQRKELEEDQYANKGDAHFDGDAEAASLTD